MRSDEERLAFLRQGVMDNEEHGHLYELVAAQVFSALGPTGTQYLEDIVQDVALRVHRGVNNFHGRSALDSWIIRIAKNAVKTAVRPGMSVCSRPGTRSDYSLEDIQSKGEYHIAAEPTQEQAMLRAERSAALHAALSKVGSPHREVIQALYFDGYSQPEMAQREGIPTGTVASRRGRGLQQLRTLLYEDPVFA